MNKTANSQTHTVKNQAPSAAHTVVSTAQKVGGAASANRPDVGSPDGHMSTVSYLTKSSPIVAADALPPSSSSSDPNVAMNPAVLAGSATPNVPDSTALQYLPAPSMYGYDYFACQARCKIPNCSICYSQQANSVNPQFVQRPGVYPSPTAAASGIVYSPDSNAPACYIWFESEAQKRLYQTQLALSQLNVNATQAVGIPAKYAAAGIPLTQLPANQMDGAVMVPDPMLTVGPQSLTTSQSVMTAVSVVNLD